MQTLDVQRWTYSQQSNGTWLASPTLGYLTAITSTYSKRECQWLATLPYPENIVDNAKVRGWGWFIIDDYHFLCQIYGL